jgi:hypothetical protein
MKVKTGKPGYGRTLNVEDDNCHLHAFNDRADRQYTIWVYCKHENCPGANEEWQAGVDQYGLMEGDKNLLGKCEHIKHFLKELGYDNDFVANKDPEGFFVFFEGIFGLLPVQS